MKTIKIIICTGLLFGTLTGCSSQPVETTEMSEVTDYSVVGKWNGKSSDNTISYDFKEDGTYVTSQTNAKGEKGKEVRSYCKTGCIGCGMCVRNCPEQAIKLEDNLAVIDYSICIGCGKCAEKCPSKCIKKI